MHVQPPGVMTDWGAILAGMFARKGSEALRASKASKKALKAVAKAQGGAAASPESLRASLDAFLKRGAGGFRLEGDKVVKAAAAAATAQGKIDKKKRRKDAAEAGSNAQQPPAAVAAAAGEVPNKKPKRKHKAGVEQAGDEQRQQQQQQQPHEAAEANGSKKASKKRKAAAAQHHPAQHADQEQQAAPEQSNGSRKEKKSKKRKGSAAQQEQQEQDAEQADDADGTIEQEAVLPSGKRRKKAARSAAEKAAGTAAGFAAGGGATAVGFTAGVDDVDDEPELRWRENQKRQHVKSGAFSKAEKERLRDAVLSYAAKKGHSTEEFSWLYGSSKSGETKGMWSKIARALPDRTVKSVWAAGTRMFHEGNYQGKWTPEQDAQLLQLVSERGRKWKEIGGALGRMPEACRDRWLSIRLGDQKLQGPWSVEETERLRKAVQDYLAMRTAAERQPGGQGEGEEEATLTLEDIEGAAAEPAVDEDGAAAFTVSRRVVLDDIDWNVVSEAVGTRSNVQCLEKWYTQLSPSMVSTGEWGSGDDRRLLRALFLSGASHDYELDWGQLVKGRNAAQCRRRWRLMVKVVADHRDMEFAELVGSLVDKYLPQLRERVEAAGTPAGGQEAEGWLASAAV